MVKDEEAPQQGPPQGPPPSYDEVFAVPRQKWNDVWAGILLIAVMTGFTAVSAIALHSIGFAAIKQFLSDQSGLPSTLLPVVVIVALVASYIYFWLARLFTKQFIWITGICNIVMGVLTAVYMFVRRDWGGGIIFALFAIFSIICFISWIPRIPFSVLMLQTTTDIGKTYGHVHIVSAVGGLVAAAFAAWFSVTLLAVYAHFGNQQAVWMGLFFFLTFAAYWFTEWIKNTIHTTIAGVYGSWYFHARSYPRRVTRGALRRALTTSFGSISFGSLIVAIIQFLQQLCSVARQQEAAQGDIVGTILFCVLGCFISILQWAAEFINRYAFCHIALYGKPFIQAARDTWRMIKDRGIDALINECLINPVLGFGSLAVAYACAFTAYIYMVLHGANINSGSSVDLSPNAVTAGATAFAFVIGLQICSIFTVPISSGFETIFVAMAWDPEVMIRDHPDLYNRMIQVYPQVQQAIHA